MSHLSTVKGLDIPHTSNDSSHDLLLSKKISNGSASNVSSSNESIASQNPNRRAVKSCFWSTAIFSINFISSILVINLSKWIYVKHHFPNLTLTTINFFLTFFLLIFCLQVKIFSYIRLPILTMIPISACFGGFIAFSNLSLQYNTVGTYQLIKLQVTPVVMLISWLFFKAHYPLPIILSFVPVLMGTLISTYYDLQFNMFGLICAMTSVLFTAIYQILVENYQKTYNCDSLQLLFYQAPLSGLLLLVVVPFIEPISNLEKFMNVNMLSLVLLCGLIAFFVNFSIFWVIGNLSAVAYNMIGHSKTLLIIFIGSILFHEPLNQRQIFGLGFTMCGVFIYSYFKYIRKLTK
jgi:solute carrier family 35 protein E3